MSFELATDRFAVGRGGRPTPKPAQNEENLPAFPPATIRCSDSGEVNLGARRSPSTTRECSGRKDRPRLGRRSAIVSAMRLRSRATAVRNAPRAKRMGRGASGLASVRVLIM
jgi:hypothetical protein